MAIKELSNVQIKSGSSWYKLCPFPIGFIYLSQNSTSPATTFGGTWAALNEDRFLRPSNAWTTGGSKKISIKQMPSHQHPRQVTTWASGLGGLGLACSNDNSNYLSNTAMDSEGESVGGGQITGPNTAIATAGIALLNLYLLDGGER